jgi:hypothetical protein
MASPYIVGEDAVPVCSPVGSQAGDLIMSLTYNTYLGRFLALQPLPGSGTGCGYYYSLSSDMVHWTSPRLLAALPLAYVGSGCEAIPGQKTGSTLYGSLIDPADTSVNFENTGQHPYLYFSRWTTSNELSRELVRVPITLTKR